MSFFSNLEDKLRKLFFPYYYCDDGVSLHDFDWTTKVEKTETKSHGICKNCRTTVDNSESNYSSREVWTDNSGKIIRKKTVYYTLEF